MNLFKNACVFSAELPAIDMMVNHLAEIPFEPIGETFVSRAGFILNSATAELVTPIEGGYSFSVRLDEKLLPKSAVKRAINDAIQSYADDNELDIADLDEDLIGLLSEQTMTKLIANALIKTSIVHCFYSEAAQYLIVPTTSKPLAQTVMSLLIKAVGSVKTSTIHVSNIKGGLTMRLKNFLGVDGEPGDEEAFSGFKLGASCLLKAKADRAKFDMADLTSARAGLVESLDGDMEVELMELIHAGVAFKLTHDFKLRGIQFLNELSEEEEQQLEEADSAFAWRLIAATQLLQVVALIEAICALFEYKREELTEAHIQTAPADEVPPTEGEVDSLYAEAVAFVREGERTSISAVQRKFKVGYNRAARMIERMVEDGVMTPGPDYDVYQENDLYRAKAKI
jgi:recombination associated protein RdgC